MSDPARFAADARMTVLQGVPAGAGLVAAFPGLVRRMFAHLGTKAEKRRFNRRSAKRTGAANP